MVSIQRPTFKLILGFEILHIHSILKLPELNRLSYMTVILICSHISPHIQPNLTLSYQQQTVYSAILLFDYVIVAEKLDCHIGAYPGKLFGVPMLK